MPRSRIALPLLVALPALLVAFAGLFHPIFLNPDTAERWQTAHLLLLPGFPLLAVALFALLRGERGPAAWGARLLAVAYAVLYGALDTIAGIGAPAQVIRAAERGDPAPPINDLFEIGDKLGALGVYSLAAAVALTGYVLFLRHRSPLVVGGAVLAVAACKPFLDQHVFRPYGVLAMVGIGVGLGLIEAGRQRSLPTA